MSELAVTSLCAAIVTSGRELARETRAPIPLMLANQSVSQSVIQSVIQSVSHSDTFTIFIPLLQVPVLRHRISGYGTRSSRHTADAN